jgi:hypothetical protein
VHTALSGSIRILNHDTSNALETSILKLQIFAKRTLGQDDFISGIEENIASLLNTSIYGGYCDVYSR